MENINKQLKTMGFWEKLKNKFYKDLFTFSSKTKLRSKKISKIFLLLVMYVLATTGIVFSALNLTNRTDKKGLFGDTYSITYKLNTDPSDYEKAKEQTKNSAESFSNWLLASSISNNGVSYETKKEKDESNNERYYGYLYVEYINVDKFFSHDLDEDVNVDPTIVASKHMNNTSIEVWQYDRGPGNPTKLEDYITKDPLINYNDFNYDSVRNDTREKNDSDNKPQNNFGVLLDLKNSKNLSSSSKFKEQADAEDYSIENNGELKWYIFSGIDALVNKLNFAKYTVLNFEKSKNNPSISIEEQEKWKLNFEALNNSDPNLVSWAQEAIKTNIPNQWDETVITKYKLFYFYLLASLSDDDPLKNTISIIPNGANSTLVSIVDEHILGVVTKDNYKQWIPTSGSSINFENINKISIQKSGANESVQRDLIFQLKNLSLDSQFVVSNENATIGNEKEFHLNGTGWIGKPFIKESVTKLSSYSAILLVSAVILLIIAIIVSILYRIPGIIGSFAIISSIAFSAGIMVLLNINFSIATVIGLFIGLILSIICVSFSMERVRRLIAQKNSIFDSIQTAIRKSMMTTIDLNVTTIILGLALFFVSKGDLPDLGLILILTPTITLGTMFVFFYFPLYIYSGYRKTWKLGLTITKLVPESRIKIWFDDKKWWIIWGVLFAFLLLTLIVVFSIGVNNSSFGNGMVVTISGLDQTTSDKIAKLFDNNWFDYEYIDGNFFIRSGRNFTKDEVLKIIESSTTSFDQSLLNVFNSSPTIPSKIFISGFYGLLAGFGAISLYYVVRSNVLNVIPLFLQNIFVSITCASFSYALQLPISNFFIYGLIMAGVIGNISACLYISVIRTRFNRKHIFELDRIRIFIINNIKSLMNTFIMVSVLNLTMFLVLALTVSPTTIYLFINLGILGFLSMHMSLFLTAHIYYYVIIVRQLYLNKVFNNLDNRLNNKFAEVDEQLIYSINKFH